MPVEITLPLTKLEQAVADARANEKIMAAKVEEAKLVLKSAKTAWEEAVGEVFRALDEMIADKRQPSLFDERSTEEHEPVASTGSDTEAAASGTATESPEVVTVEILTPSPTVTDAPFPDLEPTAPNTLAAGPSWRVGHITEHIDADPAVFDALELFGVVTLGGLADALKDGMTFNLSEKDVRELQEVIEDVSQEDEEPIKFNRDEPIAVTVKEAPATATSQPDPFDPPAEVAGAEPAKPAKKGRGGRKKKAQAEAEPVEPEAVPSLDDL